MPTESNPKLIADTSCRTGENPYWHPDEQVLYWVDIPPGLIYRFDPKTETHKLVFDAKRTIGGFTVEADGSLLLFMDRGTVGRWRDGKFDVVIEEVPLAGYSRFNDIIADPEGRVYAGVVETDTESGRLLRLEKGKEPVMVMDGLTIPNGLGFTPDLTGLYFTDSNQQRIYRFDYDRATGDLSNRRVWLQTPSDGGLPDGMTVDVNGDVWSARWDGRALHHYSPDAIEIEKIVFPANQVSSIAFGGPEYDVAYVTTAGGHDRAKNGEKAGALFQIDLGVRGRPEFRSNLGS
jgi:sugar lactone lactonase YvrE